MARLDGDAFLEPLSPQLPCGPDLEREFDLDFTGFVVDAEGLLPRSFFEFKRDTTVLRARLDGIVALSGRTRDLRLLTLYAKFAILDRDLAEFANALSVISRALEERWADIHPQAEEGDFGLRAAALSNLEDTPHVITPLQHAVLLRHRTLGDITFRMVQVARGVIQPRPGEIVADLPALERALETVERERLSAVRELFRTVLAAISRIEAACADKPGMPTLELPKLTALATEAAALLTTYLPGDAPPEGAPEAQPDEDEEADESAPAADATGRAPDTRDLLRNRAGAAAALSGIEAYFQKHEPSSPALVLVSFAGRLMDRPFYEVLQLIVPDQAPEAELKIAGDTFRVSLARIASDGEAGARTDDAEPVDVPVLETRRDTLRLMTDLCRYLRAAEPGNPAPLLLDRAAELAGRDFSSLLKDMFTDAALRAMRGQEA